MHDDAIGSDYDYPRLLLQTMRYWDHDPFVLGVRLEGNAAGGGGPFYSLPYLRMRGVPAFRYLGRFSFLGEVEPVWRITPRWSWLGFLSVGQAVFDEQDFGHDETIVAGGTGFRYLIARQQGLSLGLDVAVGPEEAAVYFIIGSFWTGF